MVHPFSREWMDGIRDVNVHSNLIAMSTDKD
jgi:hypothetical protein